MAAAKCRSCGAPIEWAFTEKGRRMPLDADPRGDGRFVKISARASEPGMTPIVQYLREEQLDGTQTLYTSHFATCPDATTHRKPRR